MNSQEHGATVAANLPHLQTLATQWKSKSRGRTTNERNCTKLYDLKQDARRFIHGMDELEHGHGGGGNIPVDAREEEGGSMKQFRARRVSGVLPALSPCSGEVLGAVAFWWWRCVRGGEGTGERKKKTSPPPLHYL